jgi:MFS family permease
VLTSFYISYIAFEWLTILWRIIPAHIFTSLIVLSWGIFASSQAFATSFAHLIILRVLLGIGEAGFTGIPYFLSFFYRKDELALRTGYFISAAPLATSFASSLAWLILKFGEKAVPGLAGWRLLFLVEGLPSVVVAVVAWFVVPDGPAHARYLSKRQKKVARLRLRREEDDPADAGTGSGLTLAQIAAALTDPKTWLVAAIFFLTNMSFSSMPVFLPTILRSMGHGVLASQALAAPPYLLSFCVVIATAYWSDKHKSRSTPLICHALLSASGYLALSLAERTGLGAYARYAAIYPACIGFFSVITLVITWNLNIQQQAGRGPQSVAFVVMQVLGQCGPLVGTRLYPAGEAPYFVRGMATCALAMGVVAGLAVGLRVYLERRNGRGGKEGGGGYTL